MSPSPRRPIRGRRTAALLALLLAPCLLPVGPFAGPRARPRPRATAERALYLPLGLRGRLPAGPTAPAPTASPPAAGPSPTATLAPTRGPTPPAATPAPPVAGHPRLWVTAADLPRLRAWASPGNPMYRRGLLAAAEAGRARADAHWSWSAAGGSGRPDAGWQDQGGREWERDYTEAYAELFAFMSLVAPDPAERAAYAGRARDMLMWIMRQAALGPAAGQPFRDPVFATYNRANAQGMALPLTVDWIYGTLSDADKAVIRTVFLRWLAECHEAYPISRGPLVDPEVVNDLRLLGSGPAQSAEEQAMIRRQLRWVANNYWLGHFRSVTLMALALDPDDDPTGALATFRAAVTGHWLYAAYALFEDAGTVRSALGVPPGNGSLGLASGGLPVEGTLYGASLGYLAQTLLALRSAGHDDPRAFGPQAGLADSPFWDRALAGFLHSISPSSQLPDPASGLGYLGPIYVPATYGDLLRDWVTWEGILLFGPLAVLDQRSGRADRLGSFRWILSEALQGGPDRLYDRASNIWGNGDATDSILYFLAFAPGAPPAEDPRPGLPLAFVDRPYGRLLARTDWGPDATWLSFKCSWMAINHQNGDCNQFELYRKGEWLTKERSGYADDAVLMTSDYHNTLALQNHLPASPLWFETETIARGGQWTNGSAAGDPTTRFGRGPGYVFAEGDGTPLYNRPPDAMDIQHASRSLVWLQPDTVLVYDRARSGTAGRFKRFNLVLTAPASVQGRRAVAVTPRGQRLVVDSLLPAAASLQVLPAERFRTVAELEPSQARLVVEDPAGPADIRFLHVLQGLDAGAPEAPVTLLREPTDPRFEGALVGEVAVLFAVTLGPGLEQLTVRLPLEVRDLVATGLAPGAAYGVGTRVLAGARELSLRRGGGEVLADDAGLAWVALGTPAHGVTGSPRARAAGR